jgi:hypothetical protein
LHYAYLSDFTSIIRYREGSQSAPIGTPTFGRILYSVRIAMLGPISWRTPPRHYGPWELVTSLLTEALVARGVDVTLFATADSQTAGTLAAVCPRPYSEDPSIDAVPCSGTRGVARSRRVIAERRRTHTRRVPRIPAGGRVSLRPPLGGGNRRQVISRPRRGPRRGEISAAPLPHLTSSCRSLLAVLPSSSWR